MEAQSSLDNPPNNENAVTVLTLRVCDCPHGQHASTRDAHPQYTGATISSVLTLAGLKPRHAYRIRDSLFAALADAVRATTPPVALLEAVCLPTGHWSVTVARQELERALLMLLDSDAQTILGGQDMLRVACSIRERRQSVCVLLCGTSGTGKSTLASLTAQRLGISTVVSTDSIRNMLRSFGDEQRHPLLWVSTYEVGAYLAAKQLPQWRSLQHDPRLLAVKGYKAQCEPVMESLDRLIGVYAARGESLVVEGVHLSLNVVLRQLMPRHPGVLPFLIHISNEAKHRERFAVRAKYMTLDPKNNRYVKYFRNIRNIQEYLVTRADKQCVPKIDNTNVDRSVAVIHATLLGCLRRAARGERLLDPGRAACPGVLAEYLQCKGATWSSKDMLQLIRSKQQQLRGPWGQDVPSSSSTATPRGPLSEANGDDGALEEDDGRSLYGDSQGDGSDAPPGGGDGVLSEEEDTPADAASQDGSVMSGAQHDSDDEGGGAHRL